MFKKKTLIFVLWIFLLGISLPAFSQEISGDCGGDSDEFCDEILVPGQLCFRDTEVLSRVEIEECFEQFRTIFDQVTQVVDNNPNTGEAVYFAIGENNPGALVVRVPGGFSGVAGLPIPTD